MDVIDTQIVALLPRLRRLALALTGRHFDADDLVQMTVERALSRKVQWQSGTRLDSWMFQIMKNARIDHARAQTRRLRVMTSGENVDEVGDDSAAANAIEARIDAIAVHRLMASLPDEQRVAVALVLVDGMSYREAADVTEVPIGTLTSRLVRARTALAAGLRQNDEVHHADR